MSNPVKSIRDELKCLYSQNLKTSVTIFSPLTVRKTLGIRTNRLIWTLDCEYDAPCPSCVSTGKDTRPLDHYQAVVRLFMADTSLTRLIRAKLGLLLKMFSLYINIENHTSLN